MNSEMKKAMYAAFVKWQTLPLLLILTAAFFYFTSIDFTLTTVNRADAAFIMLLSVSCWLVYKTHWWVQKGFMTFQAAKAQQAASTEIIQSIMNHIPEEHHDTVLNGIVEDGIGKVIKLVEKSSNPEGQQSTPPSD